MPTTNNQATITITTRYKSPIPQNVDIIQTKPEFGKIQDANQGTLLYPENGGYYLKYPEGTVVAIASDRLCSVLDESYLSLCFYYEREGLHTKAEELMEDFRKAGIDADSLKRDASDELKSGACVLDRHAVRDASDDGQHTKADS